EDGIRDKLVTGVQTCALPIWARPARRGHDARRDAARDGERAPGVLRLGQPATVACGSAGVADRGSDEPERRLWRPRRRALGAHEIGRASCRERVETPVRAGAP